MGIKWCVTCADQVSFFPFCLGDETKKKTLDRIINRIWNMLALLNLIRRIFQLCYTWNYSASFPVVLCNFGCDITCQAILGDPGQLLCHEILCLVLSSLAEDVLWGLFVKRSLLRGGEMNAWWTNPKGCLQGGYMKVLSLLWSHRYGQNLVFFSLKSNLEFILHQWKWKIKVLAIYYSLKYNNFH